MRRRAWLQNVLGALGLAAVGAVEPSRVLARRSSDKPEFKKPYEGIDPHEVYTVELENKVPVVTKLEDQGVRGERLEFTWVDEQQEAERYVTPQVQVFQELHTVQGPHGTGYTGHIAPEPHGAGYIAFEADDGRHAMLVTNFNLNYSQPVQSMEFLGREYIVHGRSEGHLRVENIATTTANLEKFRELMTNFDERPEYITLRWPENPVRNEPRRWSSHELRLIRPLLTQIDSRYDLHGMTVVSSLSFVFNGVEVVPAKE